MFPMGASPPEALFVKTNTCLTLRFARTVSAFLLTKFASYKYEVFQTALLVYHVSLLKSTHKFYQLILLL